MSTNRGSPILPNPAELGDTSPVLFRELRRKPWHPKFGWAASVEAAAHCINFWHEDYPRRVPMTVATIKWAERNLKSTWSEDGTFALVPPRSRLLHSIHGRVFGEQKFAGTYRNVNVRVGDYVAPEYQELKGLIWQLSNKTPPITTLEELAQWYHHFETIHPYQDGNGRVGGIVVATYSHRMFGGLGWLSALQ